MNNERRKRREWSLWVVAVVLPPLVALLVLGVWARIRGLETQVEVLALKVSVLEEQISALSSAVQQEEDQVWELRDRYLNLMTQVLRHYNPKLNPYLARRVVRAVVKWSMRRNLDPELVLALVVVESRGNPWATSPRGAKGLMQLMPLHYRGQGDPYDIDTNVRVGTGVLAQLLRRYRCRVGPALRAYYCGSGGGMMGRRRVCRRYERKVLRVWSRVESHVLKGTGGEEGA